MEAGNRYALFEEECRTVVEKTRSNEAELASIGEQLSREREANQSLKELLQQMKSKLATNPSAESINAILTMISAF